MTLNPVEVFILRSKVQKKKKVQTDYFFYMKINIALCNIYACNRLNNINLDFLPSFERNEKISIAVENTKKFFQEMGFLQKY